MADLDNFFAKKDKKKSKKKFTTPDELAKKLDEPAPATVQVTKKKERPLEQPEGNEIQEEDEWKEIEEVQARDYTNLKIGQLTINDEDQMQTNTGFDADGEPTGEGVANSGNAKGPDPWKKSKAVSTVGKPLVVENVSQVYVSPTVKNATQRRKGVAPDLANEDYFPTLGAEKAAIPGRKGPAFEEIKHGARPSKQTQGNAPVSVANRFTSLSDGTYS